MKWIPNLSMRWYGSEPMFSLYFERLKLIWEFSSWQKSYKINWLRIDKTSDKGYPNQKRSISDRSSHELYWKYQAGHDKTFSRKKIRTVVFRMQHTICLIIKRQFSSKILNLKLYEHKLQHKNVPRLKANSRNCANMRNNWIKIIGKCDRISNWCWQGGALSKLNEGFQR